MKLVDYYKFKVLYISQFYLRPGTPAANLKQLPTTVIKERSTKISNLFKSFDSYSYMIGKIERVWVNEI
jgi:threonylcarbamoyladenosine tRNA methylthiotransferase CDKAL1